MLDTGCWMLDTGCGVDTGCEMPDAGYRIPVARSQMVEAKID